MSLTSQITSLAQKTAQKDFELENRINNLELGGGSGGGSGSTTVLNLPRGTLIPYLGSTLPTGFLLCDGSAISRTTYAGLYLLLGDTYGAGDGSTTFNLPDFTNKFIQGSSTAGTIKNAGLPNIMGSVAVNIITRDGTSAVGTKFNNGAIESIVNFKDGPSTTNNKSSISFNFNASKYNSIYGNSNTVQPPAITAQILIKY